MAQGEVDISVIGLLFKVFDVILFCFQVFTNVLIKISQHEIELRRKRLIGPGQISFEVINCAFFHFCPIQCASQFKGIAVIVHVQGTGGFKEVHIGVDIVPLFENLGDFVIDNVVFFLFDFFKTKALYVMVQ